MELLERNDRLGTENQKLKGKKQANTSEGVLRVKVEFQRLYRDMLLIDKDTQFIPSHHIHFKWKIS